MTDDEAAYHVFVVDTFVDRKLRGNPAAVLIAREWLADAVMQRLAREIGLSETAFVRTDVRAPQLRWFSPFAEVLFCGHATMAAAHVLLAGSEFAGEIAFRTRMGTLTVSRRGDLYTLDLPRLPALTLAVVDERIRRIVNAPVRVLFRNLENVFAELPDETAVREYVPNPERIATLHPFGLAVTARGDSVDFVSRYFAPSYGIPEDPVTGSTHATLAPHWGDVLNKTELDALQCSERGGRLHCALRGNRVHVSGRAVTAEQRTVSFF